ncbi:hypothetical protein LTR96_002356 [Exophiala xenobiotica]|nr:hypothetical protein LTR92_004535 [Exophiala xenobiotica]KAK5272725.1 hypothetical protein LTR96_002356 [Exophiala xenobiotica]KAK5298922.1 hypothetical protein LTR14_002774 [Exophiala xenobiotica]KAK5416812.1 hypothetical protein LTR06_002798 [Exophiala xenobiotica]KAK5434309.1 hypothetical protein LTR34_003822 [Exophiala xenobiotica]
MRLSSLVTLACAIAALVLSLLCLFAGSSKSFLQDADLLTLNISRIGHGSLFNNTDGDGGALDNLLNTLEGDLNDLLNDFSSDVATALNLPDFFNVHVMDFCEGVYKSNATLKNAQENITECSNRTVGFHFQPTKIIQEHLPDGVTLEDLHWPDEIQDAERAIKVASTAMTVLYIIGVVFAGIAVLAALVSIFTNGRLSAMINFLVDVLAFLAIGIASAIATAVIVKAVHAVNKYGDDIGIAAYKGVKFLGMTWAATAVMLLASVVSIAQCCAPRSKSRRFGEKEGY